MCTSTSTYSVIQITKRKFSLLIPGRRQQSHDRFLEKLNKTTGYPSLEAPKPAFYRPIQLQTSSQAKESAHQSTGWEHMKVHTWVNLQSCVSVEPLFQQVEVLTNCMKLCRLYWYFICHQIFCNMTLHFFLHAFSCVGTVFVEVSVSTIPSPTLVHRRVFFPSDEKMWNADGKTRQWQVVRLTRGQLFGELALMGDQPRAATARCAMPQDRKKNTRWTEVLLMLILEKQQETWTRGSGVGLCWISSSHSNVCCEGRVADLIPSTCVLVGSIAPDSHHIHCTE